MTLVRAEDVSKRYMSGEVEILQKNAEAVLEEYQRGEVRKHLVLGA